MPIVRARYTDQRKEYIRAERADGLVSFLPAHCQTSDQNDLDAYLAAGGVIEEPPAQESLDA